MGKVPKQFEPHIFKKGESGNPGGKPAGIKQITTWMREFGEMSEEDIVKIVVSKLPYNGRVALARYKKASKEDGVRDAEVILDRMEGKVESTINLKGSSITAGMTPEAKHEALKNAVENTKPK